MHTIDDLIEMSCKRGLDFYETVSDVTEETSIELKDFNQLCLLAQKHRVDTFFYHYDFVSAEDLQITDKVLDDLRIDEEILSVMQKDFEKYNGFVNNLDYSKPYLLTVYFLFEGHIFYIIESDYWFADLGYGTPKKVALSMIEEKLEEIENKKEEAYLHREALRNQLRERILADENFHKCTNRDFRRAYTQKLWDENEDIHKLFYSPKYGIYDIRIDYFIEEVWREYKASL